MQGLDAAPCSRQIFLAVTQDDVEQMFTQYDNLALIQHYLISVRSVNHAAIDGASMNL